MASERKISKSILQASENAQKHNYDSSKYVFVDLQIRRDASTGKLVSSSNKETK